MKETEQGGCVPALTQSWSATKHSFHKCLSSVLHLPGPEPEPVTEAGSGSETQTQKQDPRFP